MTGKKSEKITVTFRINPHTRKVIEGIKDETSISYGTILDLIFMKVDVKSMMNLLFNEKKDNAD